MKEGAKEKSEPSDFIAMQQVPADISAAFQRRLDQAQVPANQRPDYHKWMLFYSLKEAKSPLDCL